MAITTCQQAVKLFPPTWQHHHLMIASTVVPIPIWLQSRMSLTAGQHGKAYQKRDASLLRCTLRSHCPYSNFPNNLFASSCDSRRPTISFGSLLVAPYFLATVHLACARLN